MRQVLNNQKKADKRFEKRFTKPDAIVQASKDSFDAYVTENNDATEEVKSNVTTAINDIKSLQSDVVSLLQDLTKAKQDFHKT